MLFLSQCWFGSFHAPTHLPSIPSRSFSCSAGVLPSRPSARGAFRAGLLTMHQPGIPKVRGFWIDLPLQHKNLEWDAITSSGGCRQSWYILILGAGYFTKKSLNICDRHSQGCSLPPSCLCNSSGFFQGCCLAEPCEDDDLKNVHCQAGNWHCYMFFPGGKLHYFSGGNHQQKCKLHFSRWVSLFQGSGGRDHACLKCGMHLL